MIQLLTMNGSAINDIIGLAAGTAIGSIILLCVLAWGIGMLFLMPTVAVITWVVKRVWYSNNNKSRNLRKFNFK